MSRVASLSLTVTPKGINIESVRNIMDPQHLVTKGTQSNL